eukprot:TRINITY_DN4071_c0_g1_i2.p3 TRINITY_DN4071_c0_g1~~TRINITY_DN4071_c0_g1_i2.p3  ORF type:complete len:112 (-),score=25.65 TRINITY_DN4071_c0_g1_i2:258-593(-)
MQGFSYHRQKWKFDKRRFMPAELCLALTKANLVQMQNELVVFFHVLLAELEEMRFDDERWGAKLTVQRENLEHHIKEEEEDMFPKARGFLTQDKIDKIGGKIAQMKQQNAR